MPSASTLTPHAGLLDAHGLSEQLSYVRSSDLFARPKSHRSSTDLPQLLVAPVSLLWCMRCTWHHWIPRQSMCTEHL